MAVRLVFDRLEATGLAVGRAAVLMRPALLAGPDAGQPCRPVLMPAGPESRTLVA